MSINHVPAERAEWPSSNRAGRQPNVSDRRETGYANLNAGVAQNAAPFAGNAGFRAERLGLRTQLGSRPERAEGKSERSGPSNTHHSNTSNSNTSSLGINRKTSEHFLENALKQREAGRVLSEQVKSLHKRFNEGSRWSTCGDSRAKRVAVGRSENGRVSASGIETCGSSAACVSCGVKVRAQRCAEIETGVRAHLKTGGTAIFYTVTFPHTASDSLADAWQILTAAWSKTISGATWGRFKKKYKLAGFIKAVELTVGSSGPHIHIHCVLLFDLETGAYETEWQEIAKFLHRQWKRSVLKTSGRTISDNAGVDIRACRDERGLGEYISKIGAEMAFTSSKEGRRGNRTPWQHVADFIETGDAQDLAIWLDWCRVSKGRQLMVWSKGLKKALGVVDETDETIAAKDDPTRKIEGFVEAKVWHRLGRRIDGVRARFMHVWEQDGPIVAGNYLSKVLPNQFALSITKEGLPCIGAIGSPAENFSKENNYQPKLGAKQHG